MKTVKFKNKKYGVRKLSFIGYLFAVNKSGIWSYKDTGLIQEFDSLDYANEVLEYMRDTDARNEDNGSIIG